MTPTNASGENLSGLPRSSEGSTLNPQLQNGLADQGKSGGRFCLEGMELEFGSEAASKTDFFLDRTRNEERRNQGGVLEKIDFRSDRLEAKLEAVAKHSVLEIVDYNAPNWFSKIGVFKKRKEIEKKGVPVLKMCKFITLTLDPCIGSPVEAYEKGKDRVRRFLASFRRMVGRKFPWAWKLEFQQNGYAHWHLVIDYKKKIPPEFFEFMNEMWGLGRINVKAIRQKDFHYLFKYVSKGSFDEMSENGVNLPDWVLDYQKTDKDGRKRAGIRFWQTGGGFYQVETPEAEREEPKEKRYSRLTYTIRLQIEIWNRKATALVRNAKGKIIASKQLILLRPWCEFFQRMVDKLLEGKAALLDGSWKCRSNIIEEEINTWLLNQVTQMEIRCSNRLMGCS